MKISLYGNGAAGNHGCEAIVRGTVELFPSTTEYTILSDNAAEDKQYGLNELAQVFCGTHDFSAFCSAGSSIPPERRTRTVTHASVVREGAQEWWSCGHSLRGWGHSGEHGLVCG